MNFKHRFTRNNFSYDVLTHRYRYVGKRPHLPILFGIEGEIFFMPNNNMGPAVTFITGEFEYWANHKQVTKFEWIMAQNNEM